MAGEINWDDSWTTDSVITAYSLAATLEIDSDLISLDGKIGADIAIKAVYNASATAGVTAYLIREVDGTPTYEDDADSPWQIALPFTANGTKYKGFPVSARDVAKFKIRLKNTDATYAVTVTLTRKLAALA